jgi:hypothetical protein
MDGSLKEKRALPRSLSFPGDEASYPELHFPDEGIVGFNSIWVKEVSIQPGTKQTSKQ